MIARIDNGHAAKRQKRRITSLTGMYNSNFFLGNLLLTLPAVLVNDMVYASSQGQAVS
jgi:hypothetical protein